MRGFIDPFSLLALTQWLPFLIRIQILTISHWMTLFCQQFQFSPIFVHNVYILSFSASKNVQNLSNSQYLTSFFGLLTECPPFLEQNLSPKDPFFRVAVRTPITSKVEPPPNYYMKKCRSIVLSKYLYLKIFDIKMIIDLHTSFCSDKGNQGHLNFFLAKSMQIIKSQSLSGRIFLQ